VVEWGGGIAEGLSEDRLEIVVERGETDERTVTLAGAGPRWAGVAL
jgi:tRNA threonylcarbamoyladenosine biosynthesis protein TsaE